MTKRRESTITLLVSLATAAALAGLTAVGWLPPRIGALALAASAYSAWVAWSTRRDALELAGLRSRQG